LQKAVPSGDNSVVQDSATDSGLLSTTPFHRGAMVIVTLGNPREKFWGAVVALASAGISVCGVDLASFDDLVSMVKEGESTSPGVVFFPMHRVERMELDLPDGKLPSLSQRFTTATGVEAASLLMRHGAYFPHNEGAE
jgi:hypothetical protein